MNSVKATVLNSFWFPLFGPRDSLMLSIAKWAWPTACVPIKKRRLEVGVLGNKDHIQCHAAGCWWTTSFLGGSVWCERGGCQKNLIEQPWWFTKLPRKPPILTGVTTNCYGMRVGDLVTSRKSVLSLAPHCLMEGAGKGAAQGIKSAHTRACAHWRQKDSNLNSKKFSTYICILFFIFSPIKYL